MNAQVHLLGELERHCASSLFQDSRIILKTRRKNWRTFWRWRRSKFRNPSFPLDMASSQRQGLSRRKAMCRVMKYVIPERWTLNGLEVFVWCYIWTGSWVTAKLWDGQWWNWGIWNGSWDRLVWRGKGKESWKEIEELQEVAGEGTDESFACFRHLGLDKNVINHG